MGELVASDTSSHNAGGTFFGKIPDPKRTHHYYIAAESELWDYAPEGRDVICGEPLRSPLNENRKAVKFRYFAYTDSTFSAKVKSEPSLGILGPILRGVVGDYLVVTFLNRTSMRLSMHPHGVKYDKESEGAFYLPNPGPGGAVAPGESFTYVWFLDENSGPLPSEPSSKAWLYHSHVQGDQEVNHGLIGAIIVTDPGRARSDGTPKDVDRELATLFMIFNENPDAAREKEAAEHGGSTMPKRSWAELQQLVEQGDRYSINGRVFGNLSGLEMNEGERVRWYLFALGSEQDLHSAHWHGLRVLDEGRRRTDVIELMPGSMKVADFTADNPGTWLFHCHVAEHMKQGMFARMTIHPRATPPEKRAPAPGFLGMAKNLASLQIRTVDRIPAASNQPPQLKLTGAVTVYEAFSVFGQPVRVQIGRKSVTFSPNQKGVANSKEGSFRVLSEHNYGVVYGGMLEFEITLRGGDWLGEIKNTVNAQSNSSSQVAVPIELTVGNVRHSAPIPVEQIKGDLSGQ
jgi:manganese oxidase